MNAAASRLHLNKLAAGAYVREKRVQQGWSQTDLAQRLHVSQKQVSRWENGEHQPIGETLNRLLAMVRGDVRQFLALLYEPRATVEDARRAAATAEVAYMDATAEMTPEELQRMLTLLNRLQTDPAFRRAWLAAGESLADDA